MLIPFKKRPAKKPLEKSYFRSRYKGKSHNRNPCSPSADFSALIDTIAAEGRAYRNEEEREEKGSSLREWTTIILIAATLFAVSWQVHEMIKVYEPIQKQADAAATQALAAASSVSISSKELIASQRAWVGPTLARFDSEPIIGKPIIISVNYQNTGREPAINSTANVDAESIAIPVSKANEGEWKRLFNSCMSSDKSSGGQVIYPNIGSASSSYTITYTSNANIVDSALIRGDKALLVQGCLRYVTVGVQHHSYFCFFYRANKTDYRSLGFCPASNYAD